MSTQSEVDALFTVVRDRVAVERALGHATAESTTPNFGNLETTLNQAGHFVRVGESLPSFDHLGIVRRTLARAVGRTMLYFMRLVTVDQQRFNGLAMRALRGLHGQQRDLHRELHALPEQLVGVLRERDLRVDHLERELTERDRLLDQLGRRADERDRRLDNLEQRSGERDRRLDGLEQGSGERDRRLDGLEQDSGERDRRLDGLEQDSGERDRRLDGLEQDSGERDRRLDGLEQDSGERDRRLERLEQDSGERDRRLERLEKEAAERERRIAALDAAVSAQSVLRQELEKLDLGLANRGHSVTELAASLSNLLESTAVMRAQVDALHRREPGAFAGAAAAPPPPAADPLLSALVTAEVLRGGEDEIAARQARYLQYFSGCRAVLDVGCGRGEFVEQLTAAGIGARGVDADIDMVLFCREKGLDVTCADAVTYLAGLPDASLDGIFCAQVVEHLDTRVLIAMLREAARTLGPGAPLVVETLNPESLLVQYRWYWLDLTHQRLVHPDTLQTLLRGTGFATIERLEFPPPAGPLRLPTLSIEGADPGALQQFNAATQYLNEMLYASYDYALVARR